MTFNKVAEGVTKCLERPGDGKNIPKQGSDLYVHFTAVLADTTPPSHVDTSRGDVPTTASCRFDKIVASMRLLPAAARGQ